MRAAAAMALLWVSVIAGALRGERESAPLRRHGSPLNVILYGGLSAVFMAARAGTRTQIWWTIGSSSHP